MAIAVRSTSSVNAVGTANRFATPLVISAPAGLAVGDYLLVAVCFGPLPAGSEIVVPSGFTQLTATASSGQDFAVIGKAIVTSGDLVSSVSLSPKSASATRAVAVAAALTGVASVGTPTTIGFSNPLGGSATFTSVTADAVINAIYTGQSSTSSHPVFSSTGGTKLIQDISRTTSTEPSSDNNVGLMLGGTGATFSPSATFGAWTSIGLTAAAAPPAVVPGITIWNGSVEKAVSTYKVWNGSAEVSVLSEFVASIGPFPLAPSVDQPTITSAACGAYVYHSPTIGSSSTGFQREKRVGVAETAPGGAQSSSAALDVTGSTRFRYLNMDSAMFATTASNPAQYVSSQFKPGSSASVQNAHYLMAFEFTTSAPQVAIRTNAVSTNPTLGRLYVNGLLVSASTLSFTASAGAGMEVVLTFPTAAARTIKIVGFNNDEGRFGGVDVTGGYTVVKPTAPQAPVWAFLGDSYVNGAGSNAAEGANDIETWIWRLAGLQGAQTVFADGFGGTGFVTDTGGLSNHFSTRVSDLMAMNPLPDVLVISGGRNDGTDPGVQAALEAILDATSAITTRYVTPTAADSQTSVLSQLAAGAASRGVPYLGGFSIDALPKISDGIHMTEAGHRTYAESVSALVSTTTVTPPVSTPDAGLPWTMTIDSGFDKKIFAHYFGPYPRSFNNSSTRATNVYTDNLGNPTNPTYSAWGGWLSDQPIYRSPLSGDYMYQDAVFDILTAQAHGIDGFVCDMLGLSGTNYDNYERLIQAASDLGTGFYVVPMVDGNGSTAKASPADAATAIATFANKPSSYTIPGKGFMISSFRGEGPTASWWSSVVSALAGKGVTAALWLGYLNFGSAPTYASITVGEGSWGGGDDPLIIQNSSNQSAQSHGRGKLYMAPVGGANIRRIQLTTGVFDESANTAGERASWEKAIGDNADAIQVVTWSDYSEGTTYAPSEAYGYCKLIIGSWYAEKFHTGSYPTILRDEVILSHRSNLDGSGHSLTSETQTMQQWERGGALTPVQDTVEVLTFLTASDTVTVTIGGVAHTYTAPAGMYSQKYPLVVGNPPSVTTGRGTSVVSVVSVVAVPQRDDKQYFTFSAIRGTAGQRAPYGP